MTAEFFQMAGAAAQSIDHVKSADAPRRALARAAVEADHHRGTMKPFDDPRSDDPQYPRMPALAVQDQRVTFDAVHTSVGLIKRLLQDFGLDGAALAIMFVQFLGDA